MKGRFLFKVFSSNLSHCIYMTVHVIGQRLALKSNSSNPCIVSKSQLIGPLTPPSWYLAGFYSGCLAWSTSFFSSFFIFIFDFLSAWLDFAWAAMHDPPHFLFFFLFWFLIFWALRWILLDAWPASFFLFFFLFLFLIFWALGWILLELLCMTRLMAFGGCNIFTTRSSAALQKGKQTL